MEKTIGILGASGIVGKKLTKELLENTKNNIIIAGRNEKNLHMIYKKFNKIIDVYAVDARDKKSLKIFYSKLDFVINCIGPTHLSKTSPAELAIDEGITYVESGMSILNESSKKMQEIDRHAKENEILVVTGAGVFPGLSRVLVELASRLYVRADHVSVSVIFNESLSMGSAVDMLLESGKPIEILKDNQWISLKLGALREKVCFISPFNNQYVYASSPADTRLHFPENIQNFALKLGTPSFLSDIIFLMQSINKSSDQLTYLLARYLKRVSKMNQHLNRQGLAIRMDTDGKKSDNKLSDKTVVNVYHHDTYAATAVVIASGVSFLLENKVKKTGVFTFGEIMDPILLFKKLQSKQFIVTGTNF